MKGKKEMNEMTKLTFENVPEYTYWKSPKTGTILSLLVQRNQEEDYLNDSPKRLSMWTCNTRYELLYSYSWDEIVKKFDYLGECDSNDFYVNVLGNKRLYREFKLAKSRLPYLRRALKREPDAGHDVDLEKMLSYIEKYNNLEPFEFEWDF
jgi:hypothetical protein